MSNNRILSINNRFLIISIFSIIIFLLTLTTTCSNAQQQLKAWGGFNYNNNQFLRDISSSNNQDNGTTTTTNNNNNNGVDDVSSSTTTPKPSNHTQQSMSMSMPMSINGTSHFNAPPPPHLIVSGHFVQPATTHHRIASPGVAQSYINHQQQQQLLQQQQQSMFRTPINATAHMRAPNFYYGTPLVVNHTIPIPHTPSHWRMSSSAYHQSYYRQPAVISAPIDVNRTQPVLASPVQAVTSPQESSIQQSATIEQSSPSNDSKNVILDSKDFQERNASPRNDSNEEAAAAASQNVNPSTEAMDSSDGGAHRSFFGDFGSFFGSKKLKVKEDEYDDEIEIKPPKKLLSKLGSKKEKVVAVPVQEPEYEEPMVEVKPLKKLKKPKIKPIAVAAPVADEYGAPPAAAALPAVAGPSYASGYGAPSALPLAAGYAKPAAAPVGGYAPPPAVAFPGHYRVDSDVKGKFIPQFRQDDNENGQTINSNNSNSTILETRATLTGIRSLPMQGSQVMSGHLAQEVKNLYLRNETSLNETSTTTATTGGDERNKYNIFSPASPAAPHASVNLNAYADPYGGQIFSLSPDYSSAPLPAYAPPPLPSPAAYPYAAPAPAAAAYPPAAALPYPAPLPPPPPPPLPAYGDLAPPLSYSKVLGKVLDYYPAKPIANYSAKYDYSMPVAVVNMYCSDPKYPCSCTIYLTEINPYNMLISGVCSGLPKDSKFLMNLYPSGDITAGCDTLNLHGSPLYRSAYAPAPIIELGMIKSDYHGVAFVNKLKHASIGVACDAYGHKDSILGRAIGLVEMMMPVAAPALAIPVPVPIAAAPVYPSPLLPPPPPPTYRRSPAAAALPFPPPPPPNYIGSLPAAAFPSLPLGPGKIAACGVIGLAGKDNSYETRELKSKLIANAKNDELIEYNRRQQQQQQQNQHRQ